jgi:hypothetical protein
MIRKGGGIRSFFGRGPGSPGPPDAWRATILFSGLCAWNGVGRQPTGRPSEGDDARLVTLTSIDPKMPGEVVVQVFRGHAPEASEPALQPAAVGPGVPDMGHRPGPSTAALDTEAFQPSEARDRPEGSPWVDEHAASAKSILQRVLELAHRGSDIVMDVRHDMSQTVACDQDADMIIPWGPHRRVACRRARTVPLPLPRLRESLPSELYQTFQHGAIVGT